MIPLRIIPFCLLASGCAAATAPTHFDFGSGAVANGCVAVTPETVYTPALGYGILPAATVTSSAGKPGDALRSDALVADGAFCFLIDLPEGNYDVTVLLGDPAKESDTTVKAESRRLMIQSQQTKPGEVVARSFTVNIRTPKIAGGGYVALKDTEKRPGVYTWDDKLMLEFNGPHAAVAGLSITPAKDPVTVYIAGDSTVTDQPGEPWSSWAQMLPRFFGPGVAIANQSWSGLTARSFAGQRRLDKILSTIRPGDYVLIQFAHNDQKEKGDGLGPFTSYADALRDYIAKITAKGGKPVLVTAMYRRRFQGDTLQDTLGDFPVAMRQVAAEKNVPLIDLHAMSAELFSALGPSRSKRAFVHYPANTFPGQDKPLADDTHFNTYGGYELARCIVEGIRAQLPELAARLAPDAGKFDPAHPDDPATFELPLSPSRDALRIPEGDGR